MQRNQRMQRIERNARWRNDRFCPCVLADGVLFLHSLRLLCTFLRALRTFRALRGWKLHLSVRSNNYKPLTPSVGAANGAAVDEL